MYVLATACSRPTAAKSTKVKHDSVYDGDNVTVQKTLDLFAVVTSAMHGKAMRIKADESASSKTDCVHPAYE
eukprot:9692-Heterococcus_DN1.PRE.1